MLNSTEHEIESELPNSEAPFSFYEVKIQLFQNMVTMCIKLNKQNHDCSNMVSNILPPK